MWTRVCVACGLVALVLTACSNPAPTVGETKTFATVCDKVNDGKRVSVEGFLRFPDSFHGNKSVVLRMYEAGDFKGKPLGVQIDFGTQANQVDPVKDQFSDSDLKVHLANGQTGAYGAKVKVSGKVYYPLASQEFDCALENPLIESSN